MIWEITATSNETSVQMTHKGLVPQAECFANCQKGWNFYVGESLQKLLNEGRGLHERHRYPTSGRRHGRRAECSRGGPLQVRSHRTERKRAVSQRCEARRKNRVSRPRVRPYVRPTLAGTSSPRWHASAKWRTGACRTRPSGSPSRATRPRRSKYFTTRTRTSSSTWATSVVDRWPRAAKVHRLAALHIDPIEQQRMHMGKLTCLRGLPLTPATLSAT